MNVTPVATPPTSLPHLSPGTRRVLEVITRHSGERLTKKTMAADAGVSRATVTRALREIHAHAHALGVAGRFPMYDRFGKFSGYRYELSPPNGKPSASDEPPAIQAIAADEPPAGQAHEPPAQSYTSSTSKDVTEDVSLSAPGVEGAESVHDHVEVSAPSREPTVEHDRDALPTTFDWPSFELNFARYVGAAPVPDTIVLPTASTPHNPPEPGARASDRRQ